MPMKSTPMDERDMFEAFVRKFGHIRTQHVVMAPDEYLTDDGDCWTAAWEFSQATGDTYVEGGCMLPPDPKLSDKRRRIRAHAWVERQGPFGPQIVECTRGYENGSSYKGVPVNSTKDSDADKSTIKWRDERASVIEAMFDAGFGVEKILSAIR